MITTPEDITSYFTRSTGEYVFARWGRPIAPVVFGVEEESLKIIKGAIEMVVALARHEMADTDPELGSNLMIFFISDWDELRDVPHMEDMIPDLDMRVDRLKSANASQYRAFRFEDNGAIKACFTFVNMSGAMADVPADVIALSQAVQAITLWSDRAFSQDSPLMQTSEGPVPKSDVAHIIRAIYDPLMPVASKDDSHALRVFARVTANGELDA